MRHGPTLLVLVALAALPAPAVAAELPASPVPGVTVTPGRDGTSLVRFGATGAARQARRALAGRRVVLACTAIAPGLLGPRAGARDEDTLRVPRRVTAVRIRGRGDRFDLCSLSAGRAPGGLLVALSARGRAYLEEAEVAAELDAVLADAADVARGAGFPAAAAVVARFQGAVVALAAPGDAPAAGRIGFYSDGGRRAAAVAVARTGRRLFLEVDGEATRTNVLGTLRLLDVL